MTFSRTATSAKRSKCRAQEPTEKASHCFTTLTKKIGRNPIDSINIMSEFQKASKEFVEWLRANDAIVSDNIEIKDYRSENAGRGIAATNNIKAGSVS